MDGVLLALLLAQAAADARVGADAHGGLALVLVGAGHMDLLGDGDGGDQVAGAGGHAGTAVGALLGVHHGGAVGADGHSAELACLHAGAEAQAAEVALQGAGGHLGGGQAVLYAHIVKALLGVHAAVAADEGHLTLTGGSGLAHDLGDGGSVLGAGGSTGVDGSVAGQDGGSAAGTAGIAAAAAVGAGQVAEDGLLAGILLDLKDLGSNGQDQAEHSAQHAQHNDCSNNITHFSCLLTRSSGRRSP